MKIPKKLELSPLKLSTIEIRFKEPISNNTLYLHAKAHRLLIDDLPNSKQILIPDEVKRTQPLMFEYSVDYTFSNDVFIVGVGLKSITFECIGNYVGWDKYFNFVTEVYNRFRKEFNIKSVLRIGIRYVNVFENAEDIVSILTLNLNAHIPNFSDYAQKFSSYTSNIDVKDNNIFLQIYNSANVNKFGKVLKGPCLDIDASYSKDRIFADDVLNRINILHKIQSELFFSIIDEVYLEKLNPKYL